MAKPKQPPGPPDTVSEREPDKNLRTVYAKLSVEWEKAKWNKNNRPAQQ